MGFTYTYGQLTTAINTSLTLRPYLPEILPNSILWADTCDLAFPISPFFQSSSLLLHLATFGKGGSSCGVLCL